VVLAVWLLHGLVASMPPLPEGIRLAIDVQLDGWGVAYTIAFSTVVGVLFGLAPAWHGSKTDVGAVLRDDAAAVAGGRRRSHVRAALVVIQVAFALLLLIAGGLVLRSLERTRPVRLGFPSENVVVAFLNLNETAYDRARSQV